MWGGASKTIIGDPEIRSAIALRVWPAFIHYSSHSRVYVTLA